MLMFIFSSQKKKLNKDKKEKMEVEEIKNSIPKLRITKIKERIPSNSIEINVQIDGEFKQYKFNVNTDNKLMKNALINGAKDKFLRLRKHYCPRNRDKTVNEVKMGDYINFSRGNVSINWV